MKQEFTLEQAENKVKEMNGPPAERFCPLINYECRKNCVCFVKASVKTFSKDDVKRYEINPGYCSNAMFDGTRSCYN